MTQRRKPTSDPLIEQLAAYDELRARGGPPGESDEQPPAGSELLRHLEPEMECIRLLERIWPRGASDRSGDTKGVRDAKRELPIRVPVANGEGSRLGRFEVKKPLGKGGYGVVFLAYDPTLGREVALKVPRPDAAISDDLRGRFLREARAAAGLNHPNIVTVYEAAHIGPVWYIAAAYCRGATLAEWLRTRNEPVSTQVAATIVAQLADGVAHAHARGVLHRDIKPANILLDVQEVESRELRAEGRWSGSQRLPRNSPHAEGLVDLGFVPKISDFGLAKLIDCDIDRTASGVLLGTVHYMAPEQASPAGRPGGTRVDTAADVYALGVILYELVTGRPPFQGESPLEVLQQVRETEVVPPTRLRGRIPRDLETICLKCLEKAPRQRYFSADALAADLRRFLRNEPIHARPVSTAGRLWRWCRRKPALAATSGLAVASLVLLAALSASFAIYQSEVNQRLTSQYHEAQARSAEMALERGLGLCEDGDVGRGLVWLARGLAIVETVPKSAGDDLERLLRSNLAAWQQDLRPLRGVFPHGQGVGGVVGFGPEGRIVTVGMDNSVLVWDVNTGQKVGPSLEHEAMVSSASVSPDGRRVVTASADNVARVWTAATGKPWSSPLVHDVPLQSVAFDPDGRAIWTGALDGLRKWDPHTGKVVLGPMSHRSDAISMLFLPGGGMLTGSTDGKARLWDAGASEVQLVLEHDGPVHLLAQSDDGRYFATGSADNTARLWDARTGESIGEPLRHPDHIYSAVFLVDAGSVGVNPRCLVTACADRKVRVWDLRTGLQTIPPYPLPTNGRAVSLSPDGRQVLTGGPSEAVRLWDVFGGREEPLVLRHPDDCLAVAFSPKDPNGKLALTGCRDGGARIWDLATGEMVGPPMQHDARVLSVAFSPDGSALLTGSADNTARIWDAATCRMRCPPLVHDDKVNSVAFSPDGRLAATGSEDRTVRIWRADHGAPIPSMTLRHESPVEEVAFSSDGRTIITSETARGVRVWDAHTAAPIGGSEVESRHVLGSALSPGAKTVLVTGNDTKVRAWSLSAQEWFGESLEHPSSVRDVAISPDGLTALTGCRDGGARLWDLATRRLAGPPLVHAAYVYAVAYSPDGRSIMTGCWDHTARIWPLAPPADAPPEWIERQVEALTGMQLDESGVIHWLDCHEWYARRERPRADLD